MLKNVDLLSKVDVKKQITGRVIAFKNKPLTFEIVTDKGRIKKVGCNIEPSINQGTSKERIIEQFYIEIHISKGFRR